MKSNSAQHAFTLIELMVTVAIIGILAAIAVPSYTAYIQRAKITTATGKLADQRIAMERYYQDKRSYDATDSECGPPLPADDDFEYTCKWGDSEDDQSYVLTATGVAAKGMDGVVYTLDQNNVRSTVEFPGASGLPKACWITKKSESC